jgi:membrane-associated protease RseP (regulator of RpoE activity)
VSVFNVIANSAAERAGMRPGDRIVSYAGTRLFDVREVNRLLLDGTSGESVFVEIERDSQIFPIVVPRGPLGISGSTSFDSNSRMGIIQLE